MPAPKIPLTLAPISLPAQFTLGTLRHFLTTVGGYWLAIGMTTVDKDAIVWGVGFTAAGMVWSWIDKTVKRFTGREVPHAEAPSVPLDPG